MLVNLMAKTDLLNTRLSRRRMMLAGLAALALNGAVSPLAHAHGLPRPKKQNGPQGARKRFLVMLDPGHGGIDSGAIGHTGSLEKHVVLEIARNVRAQLDRHGIDARLTRDSDVFIPLYDRVEIAHRHGADLFMSIHADGFTCPSACGASVFALSNKGASSAMAKYLSNSENAADDLAGPNVIKKDRYLQKILFDLEQTETIKESLALGSHLIQHIAPIHHLHAKNTEQAAFVVLKSPYIPSVLVETSFITNPEEERLLGTPAFRNKIATAITQGIVSYFKRETHA